MYEAVHVSNFRGFKEFVGERLGRLNLFVGPNNVGKTSLLEALWLLQYPAYPAATLTLALIRGLNPLQQNPDPEPLWHPLFTNLDVASPINIAGMKRDGTRESLEISLTREWFGALESGSNGGTSAPSLSALGGGVTAPPESLVYSYQGGHQTPLRSTFSLGLGRVGTQTDAAFSNHPELSSRPSVFLPARQRTTPNELADRFTKVQDSGGTDTLIQALSILEPSLVGLSLGYNLGSGQPTLRAHLRAPAFPVPLQLLGEGVGRLTDILLSASAARDGVLLVDEVENGLYYRNLEPAWRAIDAAVHAANAQLFATTHSLEFVQAAVDSVGLQQNEDFRLHRLERIQGEVHITTYDYAAARETLKLNLEFR